MSAPASAAPGSSAPSPRAPVARRGGAAALPYDPATGVGWPRPRAQAEEQPGRLPVPYIALTYAEEGVEVFSGATFASARADLVAEQWRCQVCGQRAGTDPDQTCYAPLSDSEWQRSTLDRALHVSGGPLCSLRCARLALRVCPHFRGSGVIVTFTRHDAHWMPDETVLRVRRWVQVQ